MKVLVSFVSWTGNTKKIAEAIFSRITEEKEIRPFSEITDTTSYDLVFVGFPIHGFGEPAEEAVRFLAERCGGKKVALFVTHAAPEDSAYVPPWLEACKDIAKGSILLGLRDFQGQIALEQVDRMLQSSNPEALKLVKHVVHASLGQPDATRLAQARAFAEEVMTRLSSGGKDIESP
mgnify:CR=1 FL=1